MPKIRAKDPVTGKKKEYKSRQDYEQIVRAHQRTIQKRPKLVNHAGERRLSEFDAHMTRYRKFAVNRIRECRMKTRRDAMQMGAPPQ